MRIHIIFAALIAACTATRETSDKEPKREAVPAGATPVGAQIDAFGAT